MGCESIADMTSSLLISRVMYSSSFAKINILKSVLSLWFHGHCPYSWNRSMADGREPTRRRRRGKNNVHHVIDMQFQSGEPKRKGKLSAEGKQCAAADAADIGKQSGHKEDVDTAVTIRTACRPKQFRKTMVSLSDEKVVICHELGFGTMLRLRCGALNLPLCQMLVESFDVGQSCIKIHGRILKITHQDFRRIMGLRVGGRDVILEGSVDDADTVALWRKICGIEEGINIHGLRRLVIDSESNDDIFKVSLVLYALATILCPEPGNHVDQRYLVAVKDLNTISSYDWAKFGFAKLVEGVSSFQSKGFGVFRGCLIFLQLSYLEVMRSNFGLPGQLRLLKAVSGSWTRETSQKPTCMYPPSHRL
ncbi:hypothetical protein ACLB2K_015940 [Fragaria x ananassa]